MFDTQDPLRLEYVDGRNWIVHEDFTYFDEEYGDEGWFITVPAGFVTDFASIPRALWVWLPPTGKYGKAAVIHDYLYRTGEANGEAVTKDYADAVFRRAMEELGVGRVRRTLMWLAVSVFGRGIWKQRRDPAPL